jgi:hypothetical protein
MLTVSTRLLRANVNGQVLKVKKSHHRVDSDTQLKEIFFTVKSVNRDCEQQQTVNCVNGLRN